MTVERVGVHRTHCCRWHGCKYGDPDCPVAHHGLEGTENRGGCEACDYDWETILYVDAILRERGWTTPTALTRPT